MLGGWKLYRFAVTLPGFILGASLGFALGATENDLFAILGLIVCGLIGAGLALLLHDFMVFVIGALGAFVASLKLTGILGAVAWAFCFAMSGLFFPLVLGVWWKRATRAGAIAGMVIGLGTGTWYLYMVKWGGMVPWYGLDHLRFGIVGATASLIAIVVVSLMTEEPDAETQAMVDEVRIPKGETILGSQH